MIQKLEGHHGEVWAVAVSHKGAFVATAAHDKSIRIWEKLDDQVCRISSALSVSDVRIFCISYSWKKSGRRSWKQSTMQT